MLRMGYFTGKQSELVDWMMADDARRDATAFNIYIRAMMLYIVAGHETLYIWPYSSITARKKSTLSLFISERPLMAVASFMPHTFIVSRRH